MLKSKPVNVSNTALNTLFLIYDNPLCTPDHQKTIYDGVNEMLESSDKEVASEAKKFIEKHWFIIIDEF